jgi:hypothetical protein
MSGWATTARAWAACAIVALLVACGAESEPTEQWVSRAESAHQEADRRLGSGDLSGARDVLDRALAASPPHDAPADTVRIVRQDLLFRLATTALSSGDANQAVQHADRGLALGRNRDVFTANLLIARGRAREALGQDIAAARDYHSALEINEALLDLALGKEAP